MLSAVCFADLAETHRSGVDAVAVFRLLGELDAVAIFSHTMYGWLLRGKVFCVVLASGRLRRCIRGLIYGEARAL